MIYGKGGLKFDDLLKTDINSRMSGLLLIAAPQERRQRWAEEEGGQDQRRQP
jgi:hypothetical protein